MGINQRTSKSSNTWKHRIEWKKVIDDNNRRGSAAVAFLVGAMVGGITALLFAPQTGAQMRRRLKRGAHDLRERGETVTGAMKGAASEARNTYRDEVEKRRVASGLAAKRGGEAETVDNNPQVGSRS